MKEKNSRGQGEWIVEQERAARLGMIERFLWSIPLYRNYALKRMKNGAIEAVNNFFEECAAGKLVQHANQNKK